MEVTDLTHLMSELKNKVDQEKDLISTLIGGDNVVNKLSTKLNVTAKKLDRLQLLIEQSGGLVTERSNKQVKRVVYQVEFVLKEILLVCKGNHSPLKSSFKKEIDSVLELFTSLEVLVEKYLSRGEVIGRDKDKKEIITMMRDSNYLVSVIPIIGVRGVGKTALAQLVFNDASVANEFIVRHWVSLAGVNKPAEILEKILRRKAPVPNLITEFHGIVDSRRYLLVLDGMTQKGLGRFIYNMVDSVGRGSKIIVTSSNQGVVRYMSPLPTVASEPYRLECLEEQHCRTLFQDMFFSELDAEVDMDDLLCKCANNPRIVKTVASLISRKRTIEERKHCRDVVLASLQCAPEDFLTRLNLDNYRQLPLPLKQCLSYCSLFPEGFAFNKLDLVHLWMAEGFTKDGASTERSEESLGNTYFLQLLNAGYFFEDDQRTSEDTALTYKMHNSVMEFVKHVARDECCLIHKPIDIDCDIIQHLSFVIESSWQIPSWLKQARQLRSLFFLPGKTCDVIAIPNIDQLLPELIGLHALDLVALAFETAPNVIGLLSHLRYLRLGICHELPESITKLQHLQTLDLRYSSVRVLPNDFHKLVNLRHLYVGDKLSDMPPEFGNLTSLVTLDVFIVGENNGLDALASLADVGVSGKLKIRFEQGHQKHVLEEAATILKSSNLTDLLLVWPSSNREPIFNLEQANKDYLMLKCLQLPQCLESLTVRRWKGFTFPKWSSILLNKLTSIHLVDCHECKYLPSFGTLPCLKSLKLWGLNALKDMAIDDDDSTTEASTAAEYYPSLDYLMLANLPLLEKWSYADRHLPQLTFPCLTVLKVSGCPKLMSMPPPPRLNSLLADNIHKYLLENLLSAHDSASVSSSSTSSASSTLKKLDIVSVHELESFTIKSSSLQSLTIRRCPKLFNLDLEFHSSLKRLEIHGCEKLEDMSLALQHLPVLEELEIEHCEAIFQEDRGKGDCTKQGVSSETAWQGLKNLRSLKLTNISKLESLPGGLTCITTLEELSICWLHNLIKIPDSIGQLTKLSQLVIQYCSSLEKLPESLGHISTLQHLEIRHCPRMISLGTQFPSSLQRLEIRECGRLKVISPALERLSALEELEIERCEQLAWGELVNVADLDGGSIVSSGVPSPWQHLKTLRSLTLMSISNLTTLPESLQCLITLAELSLCSLYHLRELPTWIDRFIQLRRLLLQQCFNLSTLPVSLNSIRTLERLAIRECPQLEKKFQQSDSEYFLTLQNLPIQLV